MGIIQQDVRLGHLAQYPDDEQVLNAFTNSFHINWGRKRRAYNTDLSIFFLGPEKSISDSFGLEREILLAISDYPTLQPRLMQAVENIISEEPALGRVDPSIFFLVSRDKNAVNWVDRYNSEHPEMRIPVTFSFDDIVECLKDAWKLRNLISKNLYLRDLFDYQLPLDSDVFFFGRDRLVAEFVDAARKFQNKGLFGLRKTGKTSVLFKVKRLLERNTDTKVYYYDCKLPSIRNLTYVELLDNIIDDVSRHLKKVPFKKLKAMHPSARFIEVMRLVPKKKAFCLIFDEIEYISPLTINDKHWVDDFVPFWQTLWGAQSEVRRVSFMVAGVNATVVERDLFGSVQNPMFGIIRPVYLRGLDHDALQQMVLFFGRRMGLRFDSNAISYLFGRYGGHPLLSRMACSYVHHHAASSREQRPIDVTAESLRLDERGRDNDLLFYCRHIVSELREFYSDEFEMLEMLAAGNVVDFMQLSAEPEWTRHLAKYGLVDFNDVGKPRFAIPVLGRFIAAEAARKAGRVLRREIIAAERRDEWLQRRKAAVLRDVRELERILEKNNAPRLYGGSSIPEAERFAWMTVVDRQEDFGVFINVMNKCFVEAVERYGKKVNNEPKYFWNTIKEHYPELWSSLYRIKLYRHNDVHLELDQIVESDCAEYLNLDLEGNHVTDVEDGWFSLQQVVIDNLLIGLQCELTRCS